MIKQAYINGFMRKCAERGVDWRNIIKLAQQVNSDGLVLDEETGFYIKPNAPQPPVQPVQVPAGQEEYYAATNDSGFNIKPNPKPKKVKQVKIPAGKEEYYAATNDSGFNIKPNPKPKPVITPRIPKAQRPYNHLTNDSGFDITPYPAEQTSVATQGN